MPDFGSIQQGLAGQKVNVTVEAMKQVAAGEAAELRSEQETSQEAFLSRCEEMVNPFAAKYQTRRKNLKDRYTRVQKMAQASEKGERLAAIGALKDSANRFQQKNPELRANTLLALRDAIKPGDTKADILKTLKLFYPDVTLADEALDFLLETTEGQLAMEVQAAKDDLQSEFNRQITAGRNISQQAREAAEKGLGTPTSMRDMYRDITGNPRDSVTLYGELAQKYAYKELKAVVDFLLHSLGADMKSKGPSIAHGELHRLFSETRSLQAILGVYRFFRSRMQLMHTMFEKNGIPFPSQLNFELMTQLFMNLVNERYPSSDKVLQGARRLGIEDWLIAKIIALSQFRDAIREVALPHIYKSLQHRDDLYLALLEALEDLEDALEEQEEKEVDEQEEE